MLAKGHGYNTDDLSYVTHSCFVLHNFCEINKEVINPSYVEAAKNLILSFSQLLSQDMQLIITNRITWKENKKRIYAKYLISEDHVNNKYF